LKIAKSLRRYNTPADQAPYKQSAERNWQRTRCDVVFGDLCEAVIVASNDDE
jgi:hypothetical protein